MFICTYLFPLPSHSVNTRCKIWQDTAAGDFHLFCSDSPPPVMTCKWCAPTISCYSWMDFGDALSCLPAAGNKGRDNLRSCSTLSDFWLGLCLFPFLFCPCHLPSLPPPLLSKAAWPHNQIAIDLCSSLALKIRFQPLLTVIGQQWLMKLLVQWVSQHPRQSAGLLFD